MGIKLSQQQSLIDRRIYDLDTPIDFSTSGWEMLYGEVSTKIEKEYYNGQSFLIFDYNFFKTKYSGTDSRYIIYYMTDIIPWRLNKEKNINVKIFPINEDTSFIYDMLFQIYINEEMSYTETYLDYEGRKFIDHERIPIEFTN